MSKIFDTLLFLNQKTVNKYGKIMADIYKSQKVNSINLEDVFSNNGGYLFISNHINNIETIEDFLESNFEYILETLIKDSVLLIKSIENNFNNIKKFQTINIIYFPSYNKNLYGNKFLEDLYKNSVKLIHDIFKSSKCYMNYKCSVNVIYSYKSTDKIINLLNNKEIVFIFYVNKYILKHDKLNLFLNNTNNTIIPVKISKKNDEINNYFVEKYDTFHDFIDNEDLNDIKNFLFN